MEKIINSDSMETTLAVVNLSSMAIDVGIIEELLLR